MIRTYRRTLPHDRRQLLESYRYVHAARKVVGVGSVGARTWILLLVGRDDARSALPPVQGSAGFGARAVPRQEPLRPARQRVVEGQRMMQAAPDILLGWERIVTIDGETRDFYIRQLWDSKGSAEVESMEPAGLEAYGTNLRLDARESPRTLGRQGRDRGLPGTWRLLRPRDGVLCGVLCRSERSGLRRAEASGGVRSRRGAGGSLRTGL